MDTSHGVPQMDLDVKSVLMQVQGMEEVIAFVDKEFAKRHSEYRGKKLPREPEQTAAREAWNAIYSQAMLQVLARYRNAAEAGRFVGNL